MRFSSFIFYTEEERDWILNMKNGVIFYDTIKIVVYDASVSESFFSEIHEIFLREWFNVLLQTFFSNYLSIEG